MKLFGSKKGIGVTLATLAVAFVLGWYVRSKQTNENSTPITQNQTAKLLPAEHNSAITKATSPLAPKAKTEATTADDTAKGEKQQQLDIQRRELAFRSVIDTYFPAIKALKLSPEQEQKLVQLLVEREMASWVAHDAVKAAGSMNPADYGRALKYAEEEVQKTIDQELGEQVGKQVDVMLSAVSYIRTINQQYSPAFSKAGVPLGDEQVLPLALIMYSSYGSANNPNAVPRADNVDPTGLTELDRLAIQRAASLLTPAQLSTLTITVGDANRTYIRKTTKSADKS